MTSAPLNLLKLKVWDQKYLIGYFGAVILNSYCHSWNQHLRVCPDPKFRAKKENSSLGPKMPYLGILTWNLKTLLSYLTPALSNILNCKVSRKAKNFQLRYQKDLAGEFLGCSFENLLPYFKLALPNMSKQSFVQK